MLWMRNGMSKLRCLVSVLTTYVNALFVSRDKAGCECCKTRVLRLARLPQTKTDSLGEIRSPSVVKLTRNVVHELDMSRRCGNPVAGRGVPRQLQEQGSRFMRPSLAATHAA